MDRESVEHARTRPRGGVALSVAVVLAAFAFANAVVFMTFSESPATGLVAGNELQIAASNGAQVTREDATPVGPRLAVEPVTTATPLTGVAATSGLTPGGIATLTARSGPTEALASLYAAVRSTLRRIGLAAPGVSD